MMDFPPKASHKRLCLPSATGQPVASHSPYYKVSFVPRRQRGGTLGSIHTGPRGGMLGVRVPLSLGPPRSLQGAGLSPTAANSRASSYDLCLVVVRGERQGPEFLWRETQDNKVSQRHEGVCVRGVGFFCPKPKEPSQPEGRV